MGIHISATTMADFLGNILGSMAGPPKASDKEIAERKKARELAKKIEMRNKQESKEFRLEIDKRIDTFLKLPIGDENRRMVFEAMPKVRRAIVHDVSETAGLVAHSFGVEDVDRHVVVWRKEFAPCEDELEATKQGIEWDPVASAREKYEASKRQEEEEERDRAKKEKKFVPRTNYKQKYEHLIGNEAALEAAAVTDTNKSYGMVSAESKKDKRTVEDIQAEIRAKKRMKLAQEEPGNVDIVLPGDILPH